MQCETGGAATLSRDHRERWTSIARQHPTFGALSFYPEFVCGLAEHIPHCKVAILSKGASPLGYLAFLQKPGSNAAQPIPMCDYQPIILEPGYNLDAREFVRAAGLRSWTFENVVTEQLSIRRSTKLSVSRSPRAEVPDGSSLAPIGRTIRNLQTQLRLLERDHGRVEFVYSSPDETALTRLL